MTVNPIRRPSAHFAGPIVVRCPCGGPITVLDAAEPLVCPACARRWRLRIELNEVTPGSAAAVAASPLDLAPE